MNRSISVVSAALVWMAFSSGAVAAASLDSLAWLEGDWLRQSKRGTVTESWKRVSPVTMEGIAFVDSEGERRVMEYLRLEAFGEDVFYTAKPGQNPFPTPFKLERAEGSGFSCENPNHDFPKRITYSRTGAKGLLVRIEGPMDGETKSVDFQFEKKE